MIAAARDYVTAEACPHHLLFNVDDYDRLGSLVQMNPSIKTAADNEALWQALRDGIIEVIATDHAPHLQSEKELEFLTAPCGIASLECALALYVKALIEPKVIGWSELIALMTYKPAKVIGVDKGTLSVGARADVTIFDPNAKHVVDSEKFYSKSRNCPYDGWEVSTKVKTTIVAGEIRYSN